MHGFAELLDSAFRTAHYIHPDRALALDIVGRALSRVRVAAVSQARRLEYEPRRGAPGRNRVVLGERHLLQQLVFVESEPHERRRERDDLGAPPERMLVHFLKHLVQITARRNSFYSTLGIGRVLHDYPTPAAQSVYNVVVQDPDRVKEDDYWRAAKGRLMDELKARFGPRLRPERGPRGEERLVRVAHPGSLAATVEEALAVFAPWDIECPVPTRFDPMEDEVPALASGATEKEDEVELRRMHAVLHPACWRRLTAALGLDSPERRLCIPDLSPPAGADDGAKPPPAHSGGPLLSDERDMLVDSLRAAAGRRRQELPGTLLVKADGEARREWRPDRERRIVVPMDVGASWLDVVDVDGGQDLPLLCWPVPAEDDGAAGQTRSIVLEGGQRLTLTARHSAGAWNVEIEYVETALRRRIRSALRSRTGDRAAGHWMRPAWAAGAAVLAAAIVLRLAAPSLDTTPPQPAPPLSVESRPPIASPGRLPTPVPVAEPDGPPPPRLRAPDDTVASPHDLAAVQTLLLDVHGDAAAVEGLGSALSTLLAASGRFAVTRDEASAQAALKVTVESRGGEGQLSVRARVVARDGQVLWPRTGQPHRDRGSSADLAQRLVERLLPAASRR